MYRSGIGTGSTAVHHSIRRRSVNYFIRLERTLWPNRTRIKEIVENNVTLKLDKSRLIADQVQFLLFVLSETGISPSPDKVTAIQNFPTPKNRRQLQSFRGLCNYSQKFQHNYSKLTARFQKQLTSKEKWRWGPKQDMVLKLIKEKFLETVILHHPNFCLLYTSRCV